MKPAQDLVELELQLAWREWFQEIGVGAAVLGRRDQARATRPFHVTVSPKGDRSRSPKRVLVLYPRPSSAYDIAITKILQVFRSKTIDAEFRVINFEMDDKRGREALRFAEDEKFDLIFGMGSESTAWLYDNYRGGAIPVVSVCSKDPVQLGQMKDYTSGSKTNFAFTSLNVPV
jgi:putative ABC transport system substrate-binding protein